ncbi:hypothetical protein PMX70_06230 [Collinsella aerofaciens]|uniref:hypothetical protein n=1 Tax=Collinsella aerofaciens TaxID=74426 RepID=UPI00232C8264|nr:hypothetical protein [Collinsella aerofaciens]MDB1906680.1 hypothetical protein [Collinsella aerofaciens]
MNTSVAKKASQAVRLLMMVLTAVLIFFFINVMVLVSDIQGTARVVNYAGLVRGTTQRIVKLEDAGQPQDDLLKAVDSYICATEATTSISSDSMTMSIRQR